MKSNAYLQKEERRIGAEKTIQTASAKQAIDAAYLLQIIHNIHFNRISIWNRSEQCLQEYPKD